MSKNTNTNTPTESDNIATVRVVTATENHTHRGIALPKGSVIDVEPDTAAWLRQHHLIED